jgi:hypothetical protein
MTDAIAGEMSVESLAKAVDEAAAAVRELDDVPRKAAGELRTAIEAVHRAGLVTIVRRLRADDAGRALLYELADDPLVRMLFSLHGIIRTEPPAGIGAAGEHTGKRPAAAACECGGGGCGCGGHTHGAGRAGPVLIPLSAVSRRGPLDDWRGDTA